MSYWLVHARHETERSSCPGSDVSESKPVAGWEEFRLCCRSDVTIQSSSTSSRRELPTIIKITSMSKPTARKGRAQASRRLCCCVSLLSQSVTWQYVLCASQIRTEQNDSVDKRQTYQQINTSLIIRPNTECLTPKCSLVGLGHCRVLDLLVASVPVHLRPHPWTVDRTRTLINFEKSLSSAE